MEEVRLKFVDDTMLQKKPKNTSRKNLITIHAWARKTPSRTAQVSSPPKKAHTIIGDALSDPETWWHDTPHVDSSAGTYEQLGNDQVGNKFPEVLDKLVRRALGHLGKFCKSTATA
jgi:hypothetical protein